MLIFITFRLYDLREVTKESRYRSRKTRERIGNSFDGLDERESLSVVTLYVNSLEEYEMCQWHIDHKKEGKK